MKTETTVYAKKYTNISGKRKKAFKKLIEFLTTHEDFDGDIKVYSWASDDDDVDINIAEEKEI
jgi:hypothetical protein